jgi:hypothetical protein
MKQIIPALLMIVLVASCSKKSEEPVDRVANAAGKQPTTIADIGTLRLTMPAGYRHERLRGMDSSVGVIHVTDPNLDIKYDVGPMAGTPRIPVKKKQADLAAMDYFEELNFDGIPAYLEVVPTRGSETEGRLFLNFPAANAFFYIEIATPQAILAAKTAFLRIRFSRPPAK